MEQKRKGFSLSELLIIVAIIAVLVAIAIPIFTAQLEKSREATDIANVRSMYAVVKAAAINDEKDTSLRQADGTFKGVVSPLKQRVDGWTTKIESVSIGEVPSSVWVGSPEAEGSCSVILDPTTGVVTIEWSGTGNNSGNGDDSGSGDDSGNGNGGGCDSSNFCFVPGTLITLADGTQKAVEELDPDDALLAWDFFEGAYTSRPALAIINHGEGIYTVVKLVFSDGTILNVIEKHGVFDYDQNSFVFLSANNASQYIGHRFVRHAPGGNYDLITLESVHISKEQTESWSVMTSGTINAFASDLLTLTPIWEDYDWIPMGETLRYDSELFQKEIEKYGTYNYALFSFLGTRDQFEALNGKYMKVLVDRGDMTLEDLYRVVSRYRSFLR